MAGIERPSPDNEAGSELASGEVKCVAKAVPATLLGIYGIARAKTHECNRFGHAEVGG